MASPFVCSSCFSALRSRAVFPSLGQPWIGHRFLSRQGKARPSRMILSDQVRRPPSPRKVGRPRHRRDDVAGPFAGMNRTTANIDPRHLARRARTPSSIDEPRSRGASRRRSEDRKALKMQRALVSVPYARRSSLKDRMLQFESFDQFDLLPAIKRAVLQELFQGMVDVRPTPVQRLAIPALLAQSSPDQSKSQVCPSGSFLLAAETGSGKTLAYLLPAINALKEAEANDAEIKAHRERQEADLERRSRAHDHGAKDRPLDEPHPTMARPKVIILVPTAELAQQVMRVSKALSHVVKFKTQLLSSDLKAQQIQRNMYGIRGIDVIIATPHLLASMADSDPNILSRVSHLIVDEADSLLDRSFSPVTTSIIERATPSTKQLVFCSATIPRSLNNYLSTHFPDMSRITTPNLHAIPRRVQLGVVDVSKEPYHNNKDLACADTIYSIGKEGARHEGPVKGELDVRRLIVFVNEREKADKVAEYLRTQGIDAEALHRDTPEKRDGKMLGVFTSPEPMRIPAREHTGGKRSLENVKVLVVTDLASRGIDTLAVRHVVLYDVPHTTIDFIHRLGRAGRMGRRGRGIVLVGNDDRRDVVAEVKKSMFMGQALI